MVDLLAQLKPLFQGAIKQALGDEHADADPLLRPSAHADLQVNAALGLAKRLKQPPREVAEKIQAAAASDPRIASMEIAGPGFLNVTLSASFLAEALGAMVRAAHLGLQPAAEPDVVVLDYPSPNAAKEMHVGHLRAAIIGDALARILEARGHKVIRQNHLGDWGTPFGMLIEHLLDEGGSADEKYELSDLNVFYREARTKFESDEAFADRARARVVKLQAGDDDTLKLWTTFMDASKRYFGEVYELLGLTIQPSDNAGESLYNPLLHDVIEELEKSGLATEDDGALCVFPKGFKGRDNKPLPLIVRKQGGGFGYATTDLAAIRYRIQELAATRLLYCVGAPQKQHLAMVYESAKMAGWLAPPKKAEHVAFGSVLGADGKMFKTRAGESVRLIDLLHEAVDRALVIVDEKSPDLPADERKAIARAVGIGAVKYADLSSDRIKDYTFDYDRMLAFEGNTAPYLQYAHARIRSIFRKAEVEPPPASALVIEHPAERQLALLLMQYEAVIKDVEQKLEPHKLCTFLYEVATAFSTFYNACSVLKADTEEQKRSRLVLCHITAEVMATGLGLLGIDAPQRM